jgi:hypothetical protein
MNQQFILKQQIKNQIKKYSKKKVLKYDQFTIVGMQYIDKYKFTHDDDITFESEPSNKFDSNAVKVLANGNHKGYINKRQSGLIKHILNNTSKYDVILCEQSENSSVIALRHYC